MAADSDSDDEDYSRDSTDGDTSSRGQQRELAGPIGGPLSGGLTIPATMNDPGQYWHCSVLTHSNGFPCNCD